MGTRLTLVLIDLYRTFLGPALHTLVPVRSGCRSYPTCGTYCREQVAAHGVAKGLRNGMVRLAACHPWGH